MSSRVDSEPKKPTGFPEPAAKKPGAGVSGEFESHYLLSSKGRFKEYLKNQMLLFNFNYDFELGRMLGEEEMFDSIRPSEEEVYYYCKYVVLSSKMEKEIPILALVYVERFLTKSGLLINHANWRRVTLVALVIASKIWDDDSLENVHFPKVMPDVTLKEVNTLEQVFLEIIDYELHIKGSDYAKYYFVLKTFAERNRELLQMRPISVEKMSFLQKNTSKAELILRDLHHRPVALKNTL